MLRVTVRFEDLMDGAPIRGVTATVRATVVGRWIERILPDDLSEDFELSRVLVPKGGIEAPVPDFARAERITIDGVAGDDGRLEVAFDLDDAFRKVGSLERKGVAPLDVGAFLSVDARVAGVELEARFLDDALDEVATNFLGKNDAVTRDVPIDFGKIIVGHVSDTTARLFVRLHGDLGRGDHVCEIREQAAEALHGSLIFRPNAGAANSAVIDVDGLRPGRRYDFELFLRDDAEVDVEGAGLRLGSGTFRTNDPEADAVKFAFASCHNPAPDSPLAADLVMRAWRGLAARSDHEMLLLLGDQIYGDGIERPNDRLTWRDRYMRRYDRFFVYRELREIFRRVPTYMMLDDHEVVDDFGVVPQRELVDPANDSDAAQRVAGALQAYEVFQKSHSPLGAGDTGDAKHYDFERGPAAFFMIDNRSRRVPNPKGDLDPAEPVLGGRQKADLRDWAVRVLESDTDVVFVATPVPIGFLPVEEIRRMIKDLKNTGALGGAIAVSLLAPTLGIPGALLGAAIGYFAAKSKIDAEGLGDLTTRDLADMWTFGPNQKDMVFLLDLLFDIANDIRPDGRQGNRPRAVFLLGGDVHLGVLHVLRSFRRRHRRNPTILQAVASPISNQPVDEEILFTVLAKIETDTDISLSDLVRGKLDAEGILKSAFGEGGNRSFILDDAHEGRYAAEFLGLLAERNFGEAAVSRVHPRRRTYRCTFAIRGESAIDADFLLDLDATRIGPILDHATFVGQSVPREIRPGRPVTVKVTMRNAGTTTWTPRFHLQSLTADWLIRRVALPHNVAPGEKVTFEFRIFAPSVGDFTFHWRMSKTRGEPFGQATPRRRIACNSGLPPNQECARIREQLRSTKAAVRSLQDELARAAPFEKAFIRQQIATTMRQLRALEARSKKLGC